MSAGWAGMLQSSLNVKTDRNQTAKRNLPATQETWQMRLTPKLAFGATILAGVAALVLLTTGCSKAPTTAPEISQGGIEALQYAESYASDSAPSLCGRNRDAGSSDQGSRGRGLDINWAFDTVNVTAVGGIVDLQFPGATSSLSIPGGAVCANADQSCEVSITADAVECSTPWGSVFIIDFGPDGLKFAKPCVLTVKGGLLPGQIVALFWLNPGTNLWQLQQRARVNADGEVHFYVTHFSKYGIS
jgi:hypothetical protein